MEYAVTNGAHRANLLFQKLKEQGRREGKMILRTRGPDPNSFFWAWQECCTHEFIVAVFASIGPIQTPKSKSFLAAFCNWSTAINILETGAV